MRAIVGKVVFSLLLVLGLSAASVAADAAFAYVGQNYVVTAETAGAHAFVVNVINLSDYVVVMQPQEFLYRSASGDVCSGQVFELEYKDPRGEMQRYTASALIKGRSLAGLKIAGDFREQDAIKELTIRIGARRFFLQPLDKIAFDQLARKIQNLDMENPDPVSALEDAGIREVGSVKIADGSPEWEEWERDLARLLNADGVNSPKILEKPEIEPTPDAKKSRTYGKVRLTVIINKNGALRDLRVSKGLGKGLDERALEGVRKSWTFLPATKNGEVYEAQIPIEVEFKE
ncbi:MAG: energy transducer TonB [Acidobacteriota bacterium]|jgi:TonB family protein|nr:energy transducer TonB [Acidobacteriota bacterium]